MPQRQTTSERPPRIIAAGDAAMLVRCADAIDLATNAQVLALLAALDRHPIKGINDLVPAYASLLVIFDPLQISATTLRRHILASLERAEDPTPTTQGHTIEIPVTYGGQAGPDLADVATELGISTEEVIRRHTSTDYRVYFLGFIAGFPYLGCAAPTLVVPRLATPRTHVPAGSVGLAESQSGIYPSASPGGWRIIGTTPQRLFDPASDPPALLQPGDHVRFTVSPISEPPSIPDGPSAEPTPPVQQPNAIPWLRVMAAGPLTTVQDRGRVGYARYGVTKSGAADGASLLAGNALLGNPADAAALELTLGGGTFAVLAPCIIALTGARCVAEADGRQIQHGTTTAVETGAHLTIGPLLTGARAYLHVAGGIAVAPVLGSRATDVRANIGGLGGHALAPDDTLWRGQAVNHHPHVTRRLPAEWMRSAPGEGIWSVRVIPYGATTHQLAAFVGHQYRVDPRSDRMGVRLAITDDAPSPGGQSISAGMPHGAVQVPPDGNPIILLAEHGTTGGYHVPAVVISADLWQVAQMRPGDGVRFMPTTRREALRALRHQQAQIAAVCAVLPLDVARLMRGFCEVYDERV